MQNDISSSDISFLTKYSSFKDLNEQLIQLFRNKKLIGVSLKKVNHNAQIFEPGHMETEDDYNKIAEKFSKIYLDWSFTKNQIYDLVKDFYIPY